MKKALLMFLILLTNIVSTNAQEEPASCFDWEEIVCNEFDMKKKKTFADLRSSTLPVRGIYPGQIGVCRL